jgi:hypothetical protein
MNTALKLGSLPVMGINMTKNYGSLKASTKVKVFAVDGAGDAEFPSFLPKEVEKIKDPFARSLSKRMKRLPVQVSHLHQNLFILLYSLLYSLLFSCSICSNIYLCGYAHCLFKIFIMLFSFLRNSY